ncbi:MAG: GHKL domain-containing protein, partial [Mesorhizobium sp.]
VREVASGVVAVVKRTPRGKQLTFVIDAAEDFTAPIDEGDLSEILGNLVENATRFASSVVQVSASASAGEVIIKVVDDGPGIPEAALHAALLRGVQLDSKGGGNGLGLAIVSDIVEAYGGHLEMANVNSGLAVTIHLPRHV